MIDDVIRSIRSDFTNQGVDEQVLTDLQTAWEKKLIDANVFPTAHIHTPAMFINTPLPLANLGGNGTCECNWSGHRGHANGCSTNRNRGNIQMTQHVKAMAANMITQRCQSTNRRQLLFTPGQATKMQVQSGISYFQPNQRPTRYQVSTWSSITDTSRANLRSGPKVPKDRNNDDNEDELNSDLDSSASSSTSDHEASRYLNENIILCLYEKVNRTRKQMEGDF